MGESISAELCWALRWSSAHSLMLLSHLSISKIGPESEVVLHNLFQYYLHDMAEWFEIDTEALVGSAAEWLADMGAHDVHEFFVIRRFRRSGFGQRMATLLWNERPGKWLVRVLESNAPAVLFWRIAISNYSLGSYEEEGRIVNGRPWRFFWFVSNSALPT